ncbi:(4Fe-4S)-binding protein [Flavobacterium sp. H122]|uniref:(4Fe-4S)-binding protein n=1 Tax=Flavobacterium sp. H122 TaxID=2529860 RepID=UPI001B7D8D95|nr:(4Fe-4S)-binding protein [Flavobacterium sp. H122]
MDKEIKKEYTNGEITVVWQPQKCIHSTICWKGEKGLSQVFNPQKKPWINIDGSDSQIIMEKIDQCPSGALSYYKNNDTQEKPTVETETIVEPLANGPLLVYGNISIKKTDGTEERKSKVTAFCRCGASQNKPFCDGAHVKIGFNG